MWRVEGVCCGRMLLGGLTDPHMGSPHRRCCWCGTCCLQVAPDPVRACHWVVAAVTRSGKSVLALSCSVGCLAAQRCMQPGGTCIVTESANPRLTFSHDVNHQLDAVIDRRKNHLTLLHIHGWSILLYVTQFLPEPWIGSLDRSNQRQFSAVC
jgi:hypothetical protein